MEGFGTSSPQRSPEKGKPGESKSREPMPKFKKTKMCPNLQKYGKCKMPADKVCRFAHNAIELDLIPIATKMKNLQGVI